MPFHTIYKNVTHNNLNYILYKQPNQIHVDHEKKTQMASICFAFYILKPPVFFPSQLKGYKVEQALQRTNWLSSWNSTEHTYHETALSVYLREILSYMSKHAPLSHQQRRGEVKQSTMGQTR